MSSDQHNSIFYPNIFRPIICPVASPLNSVCYFVLPSLPWLIYPQRIMQSPSAKGFKMKAETMITHTAGPNIPSYKTFLLHSILPSSKTTFYPPQQTSNPQCILSLWHLVAHQRSIGFFSFKNNLIKRFTAARWRSNNAWEE